MSGPFVSKSVHVINTQTQEQTAKTKLVSHLRDSSVTQDVVWTRGLLNPKRFELSQVGHPADGLGHVPSLVGIDHLMQNKTLVLVILQR